MKIILARHSGFCMGVRNAVLRIIHEINSSNEALYLYGPLIHNPQTIDVLSSRGLKTIDSLKEISKKRIAIRTHGIPVEEKQLLKKCASRVINLTCPRVARVQSIIKKYSSQGNYTVITGDRDHAEVIGLMSYASRGVSVISDVGETDVIPPAESYVVVSQTTFDRELFKKIVKRIETRFKNVTVIDTICDSTRSRQEDVIAGIIAGCDTLVVVGGRNSANTRRLAQIGRDNNVKTYHIETQEELDQDDFIDSRNVLVTAGTSTPGWIINNVLDKIYTINFLNSNFAFKTAMSLLKFIVRTNLLSAVAAFFITLTTLAYAGIQADYIFASISFFYIFSMYSINNYFEKEFLKLSNPYKYVIYEKFGKSLLIVSLAAMAASIFMALQYNAVTIAVLTGSYALGFMYSTAPVKQVIRRVKPGFFQKLYNSKIVTIFGWVVITVLIPILGTGMSITHFTTLGGYVFTLIFLRTTLLDLIAFQGDLIIGRETLPLWFGSDNMRILSSIVSAICIAVFGYSAIATHHYLFLIFILAIIYLLILMNIINRLNYLISLKYEVLVDVSFIFVILIYFLVR